MCLFVVSPQSHTSVISRYAGEGVHDGGIDPMPLERGATGQRCIFIIVS